MLERASGVACRAHISLWLAEVLCLSALQVIKENIAIGADGVVNARELAAGVCQLFAVGAPCKLLCAAKGKHGAFVGSAFEKVLALTNLVAIERSNEGVGGRLGVVVPVLVHEVVGNDTCGLAEVVVVLLHACLMRNGLNQYNLLSAWREKIVIHTVCLE